jgi:hypothetical protein
MLVGSIRRILHDANVHRLSNRYSNRLYCVVIDEARRTFEEGIIRGLVHIELAKRLQGVVAAALDLDRKLIALAPRQSYSASHCELVQLLPFGPSWEGKCAL